MYFSCSFFFLKFLFVILTKPKNKVKTQKPLCFANSSGYALWKNQIWINTEWRTLECWNFSLWFLTHDVLSFWKDAAMAAQHIFRFRKYSFFIFTLFVWRLQSSMVVTQTTNEIECFYYHQFNFTLFFSARVWIFVLQKHFFGKKRNRHTFSIVVKSKIIIINEVLTKITLEPLRSYKIVTIEVNWNHFQF